MIICLKVYTVALELVAFSCSPSCFSRFVPCGILVRFLQRGVHSAVRGSLTMKYHFFLPLHAQTRVSSLVLWWFCLSVSDRVRQTGVGTPATPVGEHEVCIFIDIKYQFNAIVWEGHEKWKAKKQKQNTLVQPGKFCGCVLTVVALLWGWRQETHL